MKRFLANVKSLMSDFQWASPKMVWLRLYRITIESTETKSCYSNASSSIDLPTQLYCLFAIVKIVD